MIRDHKSTIYQMLSFITNTFQELPNSDRDVRNTIISDLTHGYTKANIISFAEQFETEIKEEGELQNGVKK